MRTVASIIVLLLAPFAAAQTDLPPVPVTSLGSAPAPSADPNAGRQIYGEQPLFEIIDAKPHEPRWRVDLLLGAPSGIRFQRQIGESPVWFELGAGSYLWWPTAFAGLRSEGRMFNGASDILSVRPGVTAYFLQGYTFRDRDNHRWGWNDDEYRVRSGGMVAIDFDLSWKHRWTNSLHGEIALKLGAGVAWEGRYAYVLPLAGLSFGFNY